MYTCIETILMHYGHGKHVIIGITLILEAFDVSPLSLHAFNQLEHDFEEIINVNPCLADYFYGL